MVTLKRRTPPLISAWLMAAALAGSWPAAAAPTAAVPACKSEPLPGSRLDGGIPSDLVGEAPAAFAVGEAAAQVERNRQDYLDSLEAKQPFSGLYMRVQHEQRRDPADHGTSYALEWEAFKEGRREAVRRLDRAKLESEIQFYQLMRDLQQKRTDEGVYRLQRMRNRVMARLYADEVDGLEQILKRRGQELEKGFATREEVAELEFKLQRARLQSAFYAATEQAPVARADAVLLQRAGEIGLQPDSALYERALRGSHEHRLQELFARRSDFYPAWADDLSLRVYLERRETFERQEGDELLGVRVRVPLDRDAGRDRLVSLERNLYLDQQKAVDARLAQKITALAELIRLKQGQFKVLEGELALLRERQRLACELAARPVSVIEASPERNLENLAVQSYEKARDILTTRFEIVSALIELGGLVQPGNLGELFEYRG